MMSPDLLFGLTLIIAGALLALIQHRRGGH